MQKIFLLFFIGFFVSGYSQNEANIWYFGNHAGLDFSNGDPIVLNNGQLSTIEGCASIADSNGNLLFYTDGNVVYNSSHLPMDNGTDLHGNSSSSQSAIVIPHPSNSDQYYIFTVDEHNINQYGLQYSIVDMSLDGGLGGVVATQKNRSLLQHCSEKITAVKSGDCNSIWVIAFSSLTGVYPNYSTSHSFDTFHAFEVNSVGVNNSITSSFSLTPTSDGRGYLKISADGSKLAIATSQQLGLVKLYDFNVATGLVSNEQSISLNDVIHPNNRNNTEPYGIEFSLDISKLYITAMATGRQFNTSPQDGFLWQYDLNGIGNSAKLISFNANDTYRGALQMGPNGKIYRALSRHYDLGSNFLGVINNPNTLGTACNYQHNAINLGTGISRQGLPPFIQSILLPNVDIINDSSGVLVDQLDICEGNSYTLAPDISTFPASTIYTWSKDDVDLAPAVTTYSLTVDGVTYGTGNYKVLIDFNDGVSCPFYGEAQVDFHTYPVLNTPITIKQCDDDSDGISNIDLTITNENISVNYLTETLTYFYNQTDAENGDGSLSVLNPDNFTTSSTGANPLWVRVDNGFCSTVGEVNIIVTAANTNFNRNLYKCDDFLDAINDDHDGFTTFDLTQIESELLLEFPASQQSNLIINYYRSINDAQLQVNNIDNSSAYRNVSNNTQVTPEKIFIRVNNDTNIDCVGMGSNLFINLIVESPPIAYAVSSINVCENYFDSNEGEFDTTIIPDLVLQGQTGVTLSYFEEDTNGDLIEIPSTTFIDTNYLSSQKEITIRVTNNLTNDPDGACFDETTFNLIVDDLPIANSVIIQPLCDDFPNQTDGMSVFDTTEIQANILGSQLLDNIEIHYYYEDGSEILPTLPQSFNTFTQTIQVEVISKSNMNCIATTSLFFEIVDDSPIFEISNQLLCLNTLTSVLEVPIENYPIGVSYLYEWIDDKGNSVPTIIGDSRIALITKGGEYSVTATSASQCTTTKYFTVTESSIPKIETITITDDSYNNQIAVLVSGEGDYEFALDNDDFVDANELHGHIFNHVLEGLHTIKINDKNGCNPMIEKEIIVIRFPRYISPNGDGINDEFFVIGGDDLRTLKVTIFDRFGKIIKVLTEREEWNGVYLGKIARETDYWFVANFIDKQGRNHQRRGFFTLKL